MTEKSAARKARDEALRVAQESEKAQQKFFKNNSAWDELEQLRQQIVLSFAPYTRIQEAMDNKALMSFVDDHQDLAKDVSLLAADVLAMTSRIQAIQVKHIHFSGAVADKQQHTVMMDCFQSYEMIEIEVKALLVPTFNMIWARISLAEEKQAAYGMQQQPEEVKIVEHTTENEQLSHQERLAQYAKLQNIGSVYNAQNELRAMYATAFEGVPMDQAEMSPYEFEEDVFDKVGVARYRVDMI